MQKRKQENLLSCEDPRQAFINELKGLGFKPPSVLRIGHLERFPSPQDKRNGTAGWAVYYEIDQSGVDGQCIGVASYGSFNCFPEKENWTSKSLNLMNDRERINYNLQIKQAQEQRELEIKISQKQASERATAQYNKSQPATGQEPYFIAKGISPSDGIRVSYEKHDCGELIIPICNETSIMSLQTIINEGEYNVNKKPIGNKKMMGGGKKQGCYFTINGTIDTIYIAEGYATGKTIYDATGATVYICFDSGNLYEVSSFVKSKHNSSKVIICGDDDKYKIDNAGRKKAIQASEALHIECVFPVFENETTKPTDFNDLYLLEGIDAVKNQLVYKIQLYKPPKKKNGLRVTNGKLSFDNLINPIGALGDIVNYYNATDGNNQPLFAVQCALSVCSILTARNFETNHSNRSSIFMINIGKSATGKEHSKRTCSKILKACEKEDLISGEGYTSGGAVLSALMEKPRHITFIDEFSKYMQAAQNKNSNGSLMEANSYLMQVITNLDGTIRPKSYSLMGASNDKKKQMSDMKVVHPAITLMAMTTPNDFFENLDVSAISDGFLNRFIICDSDAEMEIRRHKEPIDVPASIIDWCNKVSSRCQSISESAHEEPSTTKLIFSDSAFKIQYEFQEYILNQAKSLEKFGMDKMVGRMNENSMRLSLIHALSRDPYAEVINDDDIIWGIDWVKYNYEAVIDRIKMSVSGSDYEGHKKSILQGIRDCGNNGITWSKMQKQKPFSLHQQKYLREILNALVDADLIFEDIDTTGKQGRPSKLYKALA